MSEYLFVTGMHVVYTYPWYDARALRLGNRNNVPTKTRPRGEFVSLEKRILIQITQSTLLNKDSLNSNG